MNDEFVLLVFLLIILPISIRLLWAPKKVTIYEYERGVLFRNGKYLTILPAGSHWIMQKTDSLQKVDLRRKFLTIPGQEILSADSIALKASVLVNYQVEDPLKTIMISSSYVDALYSVMQMCLRDLLAGAPIDKIMAERVLISKQLYELSREKVSELGLVLYSAEIKDLMLPGDLKNIFAQVVNARNEGLAALERARGESAALRNLANAAKMLENNPPLLQLRILQALENKSGNTVVLNLPAEDLKIFAAKTKK